MLQSPCADYRRRRRTSGLLTRSVSFHIGECFLLSLLGLGLRPSDDREYDQSEKKKEIRMRSMRRESKREKRVEKRGEIKEEKR